jgi:hypothetical protein
MMIFHLLVCHGTPAQVVTSSALPCPHRQQNQSNHEKNPDRSEDKYQHRLNLNVV